MTFKVTETQLLVADGSVRCGACLHVFKAEHFFVSPLLDKTERIAIEADYWSDFDEYVLSAVVFSEPEPPAYFDEIPVDDHTELASAVSEMAGEEGELMEFYLDYLATHPGVSPNVASEIVSPSGTRAGTGAESEEDERLVDAAYEEYLTEEHLTHSESGEVSRDLEVESESEEASFVVPDFELPLDDEHEFLLQDKRRLFTLGSLKWLPGITLMIAIAMGQFAFFQMGVYAQVSEYRPTYVLVCRYLGCDVPEYENHDELRTRELVIRSHPREPEALLVDVLLRNSGPFRQAFPGLRLQFYDVRGEVVASRVFRASEYLGGEMRGLKLMPAETEVRLSLELVDPGNDALGYEMDVVRL